MAFKLKPNPTFKAKVNIHVPGEQKPGVIEFVFKHKTKDQLAEFEKAKGRTDVEVVMDIAAGWDLSDEEFSPETLGQLFQNYVTAPADIVNAYSAALYGARLGN